MVNKTQREKDTARLTMAALKDNGSQGRRLARQLRTQCADRLKELPALRARLRGQQRRLHALQEGGLPMRKQVVMRFQRSGVRLTEEQIYQGIVKDLTASVAAEEHALAEIEDALHVICKDPYYPCLSRRYFDGWEDSAIGAELGCEMSTLRRHRVRLLDQMVVLLYGPALYRKHG